MKKIFIIFLMFSTGCKRDTGLPLRMSEKLLDDIAAGTALPDFPEKYFPKDQGTALLEQLKDNCDFKNRQGVFINEFYQKSVGGIDTVSFIYEFYLPCDSLRFIIKYALTDPPELFGFRVESIKMENNMILKPGRRLKF